MLALLSYYGMKEKYLDLESRTVVVAVEVLRIDLKVPVVGMVVRSFLKVSVAVEMGEGMFVVENLMGMALQYILNYNFLNSKNHFSISKQKEFEPTISFLMSTSDSTSQA